MFSSVASRANSIMRDLKGRSPVDAPVALVVAILTMRP